jgi:hypothetical protein
VEEYTPKTDEELKDLALGLSQGRYFSSAHCRKPEDVGMVFLPMAMMDEETRAFFLKHEITFVYEELSKALPRSINGMPMFPSCHMLNKADHQRLRAINQKIEEALKAI